MTRSSSNSEQEYWGYQKDQIGNKVFANGGIFDQFLAGKPNAGFDRAQTNALDQLKQQQSQAGTLNTPLGTRQQADFLQKSTQGAGDNFYQQLQGFMTTPGGSKAHSAGAAGLLGGKG